MLLMFPLIAQNRTLALGLIIHLMPSLFLQLLFLCLLLMLFLGAFSSLLEHGAHDVCCLENMSPLDKMLQTTFSYGLSLIKTFRVILRKRRGKQR